MVSIGVDVEKPGTQVVHNRPGEIACVAGSRGIPEMDPNGSAMGNPVGRREWLATSLENVS